MGRTFRKEKTWDDGNNRSKNNSKKFNTRGVRVLNSNVEDEEDFDYENIVDYDVSSDTHTTKNHTVKHTT
jgi:hypothetical protein